jgi:outer membrane murein-binding lipoprotein Lpp
MPNSPNIAGPETTTVSGLFRALTIPQAWAIGAGAVAIIVGAVVFGMFIQSGRDDARAAAQDRALSDANAKNNQLSGQTNQLSGQANQLSGQVNDLKRGLDGLSTALKSSDLQRQSLDGEVEFLNRYLS